MMRLQAFVISLTCCFGACACATNVKQLKRPDTRPNQRSAVAVKTEVAGVARVSFDAVANALGEAIFQSVEVTNKATIGSWRCWVGQQGKPRLQADRGRLAVTINVRAQSELTAYTKRLTKTTQRTIKAWADVRLTNKGIVFEPARVEVNQRERPLGKAAAFLYDETTKLLQGPPLAALRRQLSELRLPLKPSTWPAPLWRRGGIELTGPQQGCLELQPTAVTVSRVVVDPSNLRLALSATSRPLLATTCQRKATASRAEMDRDAALLKVHVRPDHSPTVSRLTVRVVVPRPLGLTGDHLAVERAKELIAERINALSKGVSIGDQRWSSAVTKPVIKLLSQTRQGEMITVDALVVGWLVIGSTQRL